MKKKLIFCICILLSIITCLSMVPFSAYNYECDVEVTSASVLVANLETDTFVYEKNVDTAHYISYLSNIMTFIVAYNNCDNLDEKIKLDRAYLDTIPNSDNTLDIYHNHTLTIRDLLYMIMLTNGNDACYVLADHITNGDVDSFVTLMNKKARDLGCTKTKFSSVVARNDTTQFSNCTDLYKIIKCALDIPEFSEISGTSSYIPQGYVNKKLYITNTSSIVNDVSPYYFKHVKGSKYGYDQTAKGNCISVSKYRDVSYACIILAAENLSEHNAFTETKQLLTWAYTTLDNQKIISKSTVLATVTANSAWGESTIELTAGKDIMRTVPADYEPSKLTFEFDGGNTVNLPVFMGQNMGTAKMYYDGELFEDIDLVSNSADGVSMLEDVTSFLGIMYDSTIKSPEIKEEPETQPQTERNFVETKASETQPSTTN